MPEGGDPLVGFDLTTHAGHFMGSGHNRLVLYTLDGKAYVRAAGTWDPMPLAPRQGLQERRQGRAARVLGRRQDPELSMLHQIAIAGAPQ